MQLASDGRIAIIGGGISGVTTAILLQLAGDRTVLYTNVQPSYEPGAMRPPEFATLHAAASVLPHSVASPNVGRWTNISQEFFRLLCFQASSGVRREVHYEIFEDPIPAPPAYADLVENFQLLTQDELRCPWVPRRSGAKETYGWKFDAWFCAAPEYLRYLYSFYAAIGGRLVDPPADASLAAYIGTDHDILVNCTGAGAHEFLRSAARDPRCGDAPSAPDFEPLIDPVPPKLIRGHYLRIDIKDVLTGHRGQFFSYNYTPLAEIYQTATGAPADVYCYARSDAWILGGSRQAGHIDVRGNWVGERTVGQETEFPRPGATALAVPSAILSLNADIILRATNGRLDLERLVRNDPAAVSPGIGYRFVRDSVSDSVRVGCSRVNFSGKQKFILHNYGHGGSGFTLSWGCAFDVLRLVDRITARKRATPGARQRKFVLHYDAARELLTALIARLYARGL